MIDQTTYGKIPYRIGLDPGDKLEYLNILAFAMENTSQPFGIGLADGHILNFNTAFCNMVGFTRKELSEMSWSSDLTPPEWRGHDAKILSGMRHKKCRSPV